MPPKRVSRSSGRRGVPPYKLLRKPSFLIPHLIYCVFELAWRAIRVEMDSRIPSFYTIWFTVSDPVLSAMGLIGHVFAPVELLKSFTPHYVDPPATETVVLQDILAGFFAGVLVLQLYLLRARPHDLTLWRAIQANILLVDIFMLAGMTKALVRDERTDLGLWRFDEFVNFGITGGVAVIRTAFLLGIGIKPEAKGKTK